MTDATGGTWMGEDRRRDDPKLEAAMAEVRHLYGSVEELATAVSRSVPRDEVEAREREHKERERQFKEQARVIVIGQVVLFILIFIFSMTQVGRLEHRLDTGHDVIVCYMRTPEAVRIDPQAGAAAIQTCRDEVKR